MLDNSALEFKKLLSFESCSIIWHVNFQTNPRIDYWNHRFNLKINNCYYFNVFQKKTLFPLYITFNYFLYYITFNYYLYYF